MSSHTDLYTHKHTRISGGWSRIFCIPDCPDTHYVVKYDLELPAFLLLPLEFWDYGHASPPPVYAVSGSNSGFIHAKQTLYQLSYIPSPSIHAIIKKKYVNQQDAQEKKNR